MLSYIPVRFDLFRPVRRHLRWTLENLIGFADRAGRCFPSLRTLVRATGSPLSTVGRHLKELAADGIITRQRRPDGGYTYTIDRRFLPAMRGESHERKQGVPRAGREENPTKKTEARSDDSQQWERRLRAWRHSGGKFWNAFWGPKPSEPGCFAPAELLGGLSHVR